ncbi:glycoside hydrolase family 5 protein [Spongiimicrobium salis]|uniref:glycoside hydrolase family 5 protein n=1 Tax=Spongiimicrobium salis TaxID=1667022 RepID=UPI00374DA0C8
MKTILLRSLLLILVYTGVSCSSSVELPEEPTAQEQPNTPTDGGGTDTPNDGGTDNPPSPPTNSSVGVNGQLRVDGTDIRNENNEIVQLRGMSLFWSQYSGDFYNANVVAWLKEDWQINVVRAAIGIQEPMGFLVNPDRERQNAFTIIDAAIAEGLYVIVDWHSHDAENEREEAIAFFSEVAERYGDLPNIIYEPYNEPEERNIWDSTLKPYHQEVLAAIREHDPDNIVICGTGFFSQEVTDVIGNTIDDPNVMYTLHYYAATHKQDLRNVAQQALDNNIPIFVTEYGVTQATGDGAVDATESRLWWDFLDQNNISHCNWSVFDKDETSAVLVPGASRQGQWPLSMIKEGGQLVRTEIKAKNPDYNN